MYLNVQEICGCSVLCRDGVAGKVQDVILSRSTWRARYAVVNLGVESGNTRLIMPLTTAETVDAWRRRLCTSMTCRQLEFALPHDSGAPLTRRREQFFCARYGWPADWLGANGAPPVPALALDSAKPIPPCEQELELMLSDECETQSASRMIAAFSASTSDGHNISIETIIINPQDWQVPCMAVRLASAAKSVVLPTRTVAAIDWLTKHIYLDEEADTIAHAPRWRNRLDARTALMQQLDACFKNSPIGRNFFPASKGLAPVSGAGNK